MTTSTHKCAAEGCSAQVRAGLLMCGPHWSRVPKATQDEIYATWRHFGRRRDYLAAVKRAVIAVRVKEIKRQARGDAQGDVLDFEQGNANG